MFCRYEHMNMLRSTVANNEIHAHNTTNPYAFNLPDIITNWVIGLCNSRVFIGLAIMGYKPLIPCSTNVVSMSVIFGSIFIFILVYIVFYILEAFLKKQLFHSRLLDMK